MYKGVGITAHWILGLQQNISIDLRNTLNTKIISIDGNYLTAYILRVLCPTRKHSLYK